MARKVRNLNRPFGRVLRELRMKAGVSQEAFAAECGLHRTYISGVERGIRNPTVLVLEKIAKALRVPASRLLEETVDAEH